jgi:uncharacterized protein (DUF608 family)
MKTPYSRDDLYHYGPQRQFSREAAEAAFLLGGIGTGNFSIGSRGELRDWEIWNKSAKGQKLPYSFFAIAIKDGDEVITKVLESEIVPPFSNSHGFHPGSVGGLPRFKNSVMYAEYPFVHIAFSDDRLQVKVELEAFTPFIPHEPDDSGLPLAVLRYNVENTSEKELEVTIAGSMLNAVGFTGIADFGWVKPELYGRNENTIRKGNGFVGIHFTSNKILPSDLQYGSHTLATIESEACFKPYWYRSGWWDNLREFWDDFSTDGRLSDHGYTEMSQEGKTDVGSLAVIKKIKPREKKCYTFLIAWYFPNRLHNWNQRLNCDCSDCEIVQNRYALRFDNSWEVCQYYVETQDHLEGYSRKFKDALYGSTLPSYVIDAAAANITVLRSNTCFWLKDGRFFGYEGCFDDAGCCSGNCTHVWNYEQTLAYLFPSLERSMRETEFQIETDKDGKMSFRAFKAFPGTISWDAVEAASDGQCGTIMSLFREWKLSGDTDWMNAQYPGAKRALDYACSVWDQDRDGVTESKQHNTYDISFYGPNPLSGIMFLAALKAGSRLAETAGDYESAEKYRNLFEQGRVNLDKTLWNGDYYIQRLDNVDQYKYQHGVGCLSDQLLGQINAHLMGLGYILPPDHVKKAIYSVYNYNFKSDFHNHDNTQRTYVLNDEKGLLICTWPKGGRPEYPFVYSHEVWPGIEYHVATHLIFEGHVDEGLTLVKAIRERHDGVRRNPWNEVECGYHYARSMASWGLILALSGFSYDMVERRIDFDPRINKEDFKTFWSTGTAWGIYRQKIVDGEIEQEVQVLHGKLAK